MTVRDIVNRESVNLANCESEPIHIPGAIQPHGLLLGLRPDLGYRISFCSGNSPDYTGFEHTALLGKTFAEAFGEAEARRLAEYLESEDFRTGNPAALTLGLDAYSCTIHHSGETMVLEAEPFPDGFRNLPDLYLQTRRFVATMEQAQSLQELSQRIAEETRRITGYDRVMVYRFDPDYNGEVIAEAHLYRACLDPREVQHVAQEHAEPFGIAHRAVAPLRAGDTRLEHVDFVMHRGAIVKTAADAR